MPTQLEEKIFDLIEKKGPIRFKEFMSLALYDKDYGFYQRNVEIGSKSKCNTYCDFKTYPETSSPYFGISLARLVSGLSQSLDFDEINIIEVGGGNGTLAKDFLDYLKFIDSPLSPKIRYKIIDISDKLNSKQKLSLSEFENVELIKKDCFEYIYKPFTGFIITNELLDAFPVDLILYRKQKPYLLYVSKDKNNSFETIMKPCLDEEILSYLKDANYSKFEKQLSQNYWLDSFNTSIPINLDMLKWYKLVSSSLKQGAIITIDYGFTDLKKHLKDISQGYFTNPKGKLFRVYSRLSLTNNSNNLNPLRFIGQQDMTSDIDFNTLEKFGKEEGLETLFLGPQSKIINEFEGQNSKGYYALIQGRGVSSCFNI